MASRRAWAFRAGMVTAMVASLFVVASPAAAQGPNIQLESISNVELKVGGGAQTVQIRVRNTADGERPENLATNVQFTMTLPLGNEGVGVSSAGEGCTTSGNPPTRMDCTIPELPGGEERTVVVQIAVDPASPLPAGEERNGTAQVTLATGGTQSFNLRVRGPDQAPSIARVSGVVTDQATGEPIANAEVYLIDGDGAEHTRGTDSQGRFDIRPEPNNPIAPGRIAMQAYKDGYQGQQYQHPVALGAGDSATDIQLSMVNQQAEETPTPTPSASPTPGPTATATATASAAAAAAPPADSGGTTFFTKVMIAVGLVLVLLGIGAIVLLIWRRRREADDDDGGGFDDSDDPVSGPRGPRPTPGSRGSFRPTPTQIAGAGAATQVIPRAGAPGSGLPAVGPSPALAQTSLMGGAGEASDATTLLPRADDATRIVGSPLGATPPGATPPGATPPGVGPPGASGFGGDRAAGPSATVRRAAPQPPTYDGAPEAPYAGGYDQGGYDQGGYDQGGYAGRYDEPTYRGAHVGGGSGGYDEPTGRFDGGGYESGPRVGSGYGRATHDSGYGPDPYTQPPAGYGDYSAESYPTAGGYEAGGSHADYQTGGYQAADYDRGGYQHGSYGDQGYQAAGHGYAQPGAAGYAQPGAGSYPPGYEQDYDDETGRPRPRHSGPDRGWSGN